MNRVSEISWFYISYLVWLSPVLQFLSMKLATVNPRLEFNIEGLLAKDVRDAISDATVLLL